MKDGGVLYRDIYEQKGPLLYLIHAAAACLSDTSFGGVYIMEALAMTVALYAAYRLMRLRAGMGFSLGAAAFFGAAFASCAAFIRGDSAEEFCLPLLMAALAIAYAEYGRRAKPMRTKRLLVCGALAVYETCPETAEAIIEKSLESNRTAVEALYAPHGNYPEGYGYWEYGTVFEVLMLTALETAAGSDAGISATEGFDRTAEWILYMIGTNRQMFNYADNPPGIGGADIPSWYFADRFKKPSILYFNKRNLDALTTDYYSWNHRLLPMIMVLAGRVDLNSVTPPTQKVWAGEGVTPVVLVHTDWTWSDTDKYLGIKGGLGELKRMMDLSLIHIS